MSLVGALTKALKAGETAKKTAPFYSAVDEALANIARPKGTGAEFYTELTKQAGVKKAELADRKLEQAFKAKGKMTKEEAQQVLKENPPPKLQEREYNEKMIRDEEDIKEELAQERYGRSYRDLSQRDRNPIYDEAQRIMGEENGPMYGDYKTPGGQNYREILLKIPSERPNASNYQDPAKYDADLRAYNASGKSDYQSSHWREDPNVLAHMRVQDRTGPNGEKILHVEEIQSDWHQAGRKKGYRDEEAIANAHRAFKDYTKDTRERMRQLMLKEAETEMAPERAIKFVNQYIDGMDDSAVASFMNEKSTFNDLYRATRDAGVNGVPDAPFKKNWHELAMKRLLNYAADNGYDSIALTTGAEQAKRFSLSRQLDEVQFDPNTGFLSGRDHNGKLVVAQQGVTQENLADYIGKEGAQKILQAPVDEVGQHSLRGADLEVGGEGMKGFYDQILPSYLNTFGKPYGSQVGTFSIPGDRGETVERLGVAGRNLSEMTPQEVIDFNKMVDEAGAKNLHHFPITPQMREQIKQKGLPLYQQIGIPTAGAGAASQMPEQMQEPELEPEVKKADGGAINYNTAPDMSDGGRIIQGAPFKRGGKVKMTTNRDTMFLELSNKKLKRK
jgi:hypothetical protein